MIGRWRLRARARAVGVRRSGRARDVGAAARVAFGACAGAYLAGVPGAVAGGAAGALLPWWRARRAVRGRARGMDEQIPEVLRSIAAAVRGGRSLPQALEAAREEAREPAAAALDAALRRLEVGAPMDEAIETFARAASTDLAHVAAETLRVGRTAGGAFPAVLDVAVASAAERVRIARDRAAATSQARLSAVVVGGMPVAFYALIGSGARERLLELLREPVGWLVIGLGIVLEAAGALWMRAMMR